MAMRSGVWVPVAFAAMQALSSASESSQYFDVYAHPDIHRQMLADGPRTEAYGKALLQEPAVVRGKVVLDFGCGTGILSLFAAKAGAAKVYCIEASKLAEITAQNVVKNGYSDVIEVMNIVHSKMKLPEKVDVIISEWMGFLMVLEDMLADLLQVRDKWLKSGGVVWPRHAQFWMQPYQDTQWWDENIGYWDSMPYGFDLSPMTSYAFTRNEDWPWPIRSNWRPSGLVGEPHMLSEWDLQVFAMPKGFRQATKFSFQNLEDTVHGMLIWFDCVFDHPEGNVTLSTHPRVGAQHWGNIFWPLRGAPLTPKEGQTFSIDGLLKMRRSPPAWALSMSWRAPPLVSRTIQADAGELHVEDFTTPDEWTMTRALENFIKDDEKRSVSPREEL